MKKQLFVLCYSDHASASAIEAAMNAGQVPSLVPSADMSGQSLSSILEGVLAMAGLTPERMIPRGWAAALQPSFDAVASFYVDDLLAGQATACYVSAAANAFFIDAWRSLCARMSVAVRFVYVRDFSRLYLPSTGAPLAPAEFNVALALLRQAGADVLCFEADELRGGGASLLAPLLSGSRSPAQLPAAQVADVLRSVPGVLRPELPAEIAALHRLFAGRRRGIALTVPADSPELALLESSAQPRTAFHLWLESGATSAAPAAASPGPAPAAPRAASDMVALLLQKERHIDALVRQLREQEASAADSAKRIKVLVAQQLREQGTAGAMQKPVRGRHVGAAAELAEAAQRGEGGGPAGGTRKRSIPERAWRKLKRIAARFLPGARAPEPHKRVVG